MDSVFSRNGTKELPLCLSKDNCKEKHLIRDCEITTEQEKVSLLDACIAKRDRSRKSFITLSSVSALPNPGDGKFKASLADTVPIIVNGDYGADHSAVSQYHLEKCVEAGIFVQLLPLQ
jgi:hypothetical protein